MKKLLALLPLTLSLCGCSAFAPVVLQDNTIAQSQNASFVGEPKNAIGSSNINEFYGNYLFAYQPSTNLFDYAHRTLGKLDNVGGIEANSSYCVSPFIPVKPSTVYAYSTPGSYWLAEYDDYGNFLRRRNTGAVSGYFSTSSDAYYIREECSNSATEAMVVEGSTLPDSYIAYNCQYAVQTPYHRQVFDCWFDDTTFEMTSNTWSDSNFKIGLGFMKFEFDGNQSALVDFSEEFQDGVDNHYTQFVNIDFEPNSEDDYDVGMPIGDIRLRAYALFPVGDTRHTFTQSYTGCHFESVENDPVWVGSGYTAVTSAQSLQYQTPSNPYVLKVVADDGYYLGIMGGSPTMAVGGNCNVTGMTAAEAYPGGGNVIIKAAYITFELPVNGDANISFIALVRPTYTATLNLNHATGSFVDGTGTFYEGQGFVVELTAEDNYGFNTQTSSIYVTGAAEYHILYNSPIVGALMKGVLIEITGGSTNITITATALPYTQDYGTGYENGLSQGGAKPVEWIRNIFDGMASFFSVEIIPHLSLGLIMFAPLLVLAIVVIVRIFKHGG